MHHVSGVSQHQVLPQSFRSAQRGATAAAATKAVLTAKSPAAGAASAKLAASQSRAGGALKAGQAHNFPSKLAIQPKPASGQRSTRHAIS